MAWRSILAPACAIVLAAAPVSAQVKLAAPAPATEHEIFRAAGVDLPGRLGVFALHSVDTVAAGLAGAHYVSPSQSVITVFVGRVQQPLAAEFATTEESIGLTMSRLRRIRDLASPSSAPGALGRLWSAEMDVGPVNTLVMIWHRRGWRIKIRGTAPAESGDAGIAEMEQAIGAFDWD